MIDPPIDDEGTTTMTPGTIAAETIATDCGIKTETDHETDVPTEGGRALETASGAIAPVEIETGTVIVRGAAMDAVMISDEIAAESHRLLRPKAKRKRFDSAENVLTLGKRRKPKRRHKRRLHLRLPYYQNWNVNAQQLPPL